jgi:hypothetical protein
VDEWTLEAEEVKEVDLLLGLSESTPLCQHIDFEFYSTKITVALSCCLWRFVETENGYSVAVDIKAMKVSDNKNRSQMERTSLSFRQIGSYFSYIWDQIKAKNSA